MVVVAVVAALSIWFISMRHVERQDAVRPQPLAALVVLAATGFWELTVPMVAVGEQEPQAVMAATVARAVLAPMVGMDPKRAMMNMVFQVEMDRTEEMEGPEALEAVAQWQALAVVRDLEVPVVMGESEGLELCFGA